MPVPGSRLLSLYDWVMVSVAVHALEGVVLALVAYNAIVALWAWPAPRRSPVGSRRRRFRILIPAHDEATVVGRVIEDLDLQEYPTELATTWVIADRCTDATAEVAHNAGAVVDERTTGTESKGSALQWHLERYPLREDENLVVVDADNRLPTDLLACFADALDDGHHTLQAYLDVSNPDASLLATAGAVSYWASNRMVQQARRRLGWSADLGGTGMCFSSEAVRHSGGFADSLTEDSELGVRLALDGIPVMWMHELRIHDEKPESLGVAVRQRARWAAGKRVVARHHALRLIWRSLTRRSMALFDLALRLIQPGRTFLALLSGVALLVTILVSDPVLFPTWVWATATAIQLGLPIAFLIRDGVSMHYVARFPLLTLLAVLWIPIRITSRLTSGWYHTPHGGD